MNFRDYYGRKDCFIRAALARGQYEVLESGVVINTNYRGSGRRVRLKKRVDHWGYSVIHLYNGEFRQPVLLHRVVAIALLPNKDHKKICINHIDGKKTNAAKTNLEWCTQSENMVHAYRIGIRKQAGGRKFKAGEDHHFAKLRSRDIPAIRKMIRAGCSQRKVAVAFKTTQSNISRIVAGKIWRQTQKPRS